jgi:hypothetical protein
MDKFKILINLKFENLLKYFGRLLKMVKAF